MLLVDDVYRYALARTGSKEDAEDTAIEVVQQSPKHLTIEELKPYWAPLQTVTRKWATWRKRKKSANGFRKALVAPIKTILTISSHPTIDLDRLVRLTG